MRPDRILIVDSSPTCRMWQQLLLRLEGYSSVSERDTEAGVEIAKQERPSLIVLDIGEPPSAGFEACRALRSAPETSDIPILAATTGSVADHVMAVFEAGCSDFLTKPFERAVYLAKVRNQLNRLQRGAA